MKAVVLREFGGPEVLAVEDFPDPSPRPGSVVVELRAAAMNWHDVIARRGNVAGMELPRIIGSDGAGVRRDTGESVFILPSLFWGGEERHPGPEFEILGDFTDGTYAELVAVPEENVFPVPKGWDWPEAAALPLAGVTAYRALFSRGALQSGETVVILGAGSGVSTIAVALASMAGARVLVTSSSQEKIDRAVELGASGGVLYTEDGWTEHLEKADLVVDSVGATWPDSLSMLKPGGRVVAFGATGGDKATINVRQFYFGQFSLLGTTMGSPRDFAGLLSMLDSGWRPAVDAVLPLADPAAAHARMERRDHFGKLVLVP
jgi:NADPH:quinone reductase-like Zn-dependent oxidoreductase